MDRLQIDGVPVLWQQGPGPLTATLAFRIGRRDETFVTGGITHLVEHLAMAALPRTHLDCDAAVDLAWTTFSATGRPEPVAEFLTRVCAALANLPTDRLGIEASVLRAEDGRVDHPSVTALLARRYGAHASGLAGFEEPATTEITASQVREHAARYFVGGNAVLTLTGPPPPGLRLPLPAGVPPVRTWAKPLGVPFPCWSEHPIEGVAAGVVGPDSESFAAALRILQIRLQDDLRHRRGLVYTVAVSASTVAPETVHAALWLDPRPGDVPVAARDLVIALRQLADQGPTDAELAYDLAGFVEEAYDPRSVADYLQECAGDLLAGRPLRTRAEMLNERRRVRPAEVRDAARAASRSLYLLVPEGLRIADLPVEHSLPREPDTLDTAVMGRTLRRRLRSGAPRAARLTMSDEGLTLKYDGRTRTIRFADVVGVGRHPDGYLELLGLAGTTIPLAAGDWKDGERVLTLVRRQVPEDLWFDAELGQED